jgi:uncharacterized protein YbcI
MATAPHDEGSLSQGGTESVADRPLVEISNAMVRIYKDQFGRGPTKARTHYAGPDVIVCTLENTFTQAEHNLRALGEHQRVRDLRMFFQYAEAARFTEPIERITGRRVRGFLSSIDTNADIAGETFVLEPEALSSSDPGRSKAAALELPV